MTSTSPKPAKPTDPLSRVDSAVRNYPLLLKRYRRLLEVTRTLSLTLNLPYLLRTIVEVATELTDTEAASIMLIDPASQQLRFEASTDLAAAELEHILVPLEGSIAGSIFTTANPIIIPDVAADPRHYRKVDDVLTFKTRSILGVPLISKEKPIGVLQALNKVAGKAFTQDDVETLEALATQAAIAIVNARLFQQSDLIAEMVHELRTPLAALTATTHLLMRPDLPPERRLEFVSTVLNETNRLTTMTTEFLDLARLESGRVRFVRENFGMAELAHECVSVIRPQADARNLTVHELMPGALPPVQADRGKMKQVLLNLLTNAVKYNREGGSIYVIGETVADMVKISVRDTGQGIPPDALPRIFDKFFRVPDSEGWTQGTGLGLAIARRIVEAHGGAMTVESTVNAGTVFAFTVQIATDSQ